MWLPTASVIEMLLRGTMIYLIVFLLLRVFPIQHLPNVRIADILLVGIIIDTAQNVVSSNYPSFSEMLIVVATILFWAYVMCWLNYQFPALHLMAPAPVLLIKDGRLLYKNMQKQEITTEQLTNHLLQCGLDNIEQVKAAYRESNGRIRVVMTQPQAAESFTQHSKIR